MSNDVTFLDIVLLGKEYRVACPPEEREALQAAVAFVDGKMHEIAEKTRSNIAERIAVMAALNIAHEHLNLKATVGTPQLTTESETGVDIAALMRRIQDMEAQLDAALASQEKLF